MIHCWFSLFQHGLQHGGGWGLSILTHPHHHCCHASLGATAILALELPSLPHRAHTRHHAGPKLSPPLHQAWRHHCTVLELPQWQHLQGVWKWEVASCLLLPATCPDVLLPIRLLTCQPISPSSHPQQVGHMELSYGERAAASWQRQAGSGELVTASWLWRVGCSKWSHSMTELQLIMLVTFSAMCDSQKLYRCLVLLSIYLHITGPKTAYSVKSTQNNLNIITIHYR